MKRFYQSISLLLILLLTLGCFVGCGGGKSETTDETTIEPAASEELNLGTYRLSVFDGTSVAEYAELMEISYEEARNSFVITLMKDGKANLYTDGESSDLTWKLDGEKFQIGEGGEYFEGTLKNGVITLDFGTLEIVYTKDENEAPPAATDAPVSTDAPAAGYDWWDGDWYGWWGISDAEGRFAEYNDSFLDAFAEIRVDGDVGTVKLWHCYGSRESRIAEAEIEFVDGAGENGYFYTSGGTFFPDGEIEIDGDTVTPMELVYYDWVVDPADSSVSQFEDMIEIMGYYTDPENEENTFTYYVYLKPWGETWEDVRDGDTTDCIYDDMMPYFYDDWYLPLLELGYTDGIVDYSEGETIIENGTYAPGYQPPDTTDEPAATDAPAALDPAERFDGTGEVEMDVLEQGLAWCKEETGYKTTYDEVAAQFGVHGKREMSEFYENMVYYTWSNGDAYVKVGFTINDDGSETWNVTQYDGFN